MKVLHVIPTLAMQWGGPVTAVLGLASALGDAGIEVRLLSTDYLATATPDKIRCETEIFRSRWGTWKWSPGLRRALPAHVEWADVVNVHSLWSYPVNAAARVCRAANTPYIISPCGMLDSWSLNQKRFKKRIYASLIERANINGAAALWFTSEEERQGARRFQYTCADSVIPLGLSPDAYSSLPNPGVFRASHPELGNDPFILFLGRITPKKQISVLVRAFASLRPDFPGVKLVVAGPDEGNYLNVLKLLARSLRVDDVTVFTGPLRGSEVQAALIDAEIFALPSLHENFGVSVIEAMACEVPVVISHLVDLAGEVAKAEAGLIISPMEEELTAALRYLLSNPSRGQEMGIAGRALVLQKFTWKCIVPSIMEMYEKAIES